MKTNNKLAFEPLAIQDEWQGEALKAQMQYLQAHSPFYQRLFKNNHINVQGIKTLRDLQYLPTTAKSDIQVHNTDFICVPSGKIKEYTATSGTLGNPVTIALTENDLNRLAYNEHQSFLCAGGQQKDLYQLMLTLDRQFMAGIAYYMGLRLLGASLVRTGPGLPGMQWETINRLQVNSLVAVPSFLMKLIEYALDNGIDLKNTPVTKVVCIGESIRDSGFELNALGRKIEENWPVKLYSTYASTEMQTAFTECEHGMGGHQQPDLIIIEIIDENGNNLSAGEYGELVITTLGIEGTPLLRYRTGDICAYYDTPCPCGRMSRRISPILGRMQQMIKYKGTTLYPPAIFEILNNINYIKDYVVEVFSNEWGIDEIILHIATPIEEDEVGKLLKPILQSKLRVIPLLQIHPLNELQQMQFPINSRKQVKFIDNRAITTR